MTLLEMTTPILDPRLSTLDELRWHVGNTPLHPMLHLSPKPGVEIYAKLEWQQFGGSVKARPAFNILRNAVASGALRGRRLLDASSGNTGIAYAVFAAAAAVGRLDDASQPPLLERLAPSTKAGLAAIAAAAAASK